MYFKEKLRLSHTIISYFLGVLYCMYFFFIRIFNTLQRYLYTLKEKGLIRTTISNSILAIMALDFSCNFNR